MVTLHVFYRPGTHLLCYLILFVSSENCCKKLFLTGVIGSMTTGILLAFVGIVFLSISALPSYNFTDAGIGMLVTGAPIIFGSSITCASYGYIYKIKCC